MKRRFFNAHLFTACAAALAVLLQLVLGALTRLTGSGLACPDWPLCYGLWFPTPTALAGLDIDYSFFQVMLEWGHRFNAAAVVAPLVLAICLFTWFERKLSPVNFWISAAALVTLMIQGGVGGLTVFELNSPWSVAVHLGLASILLALIVSNICLKCVSYSDWSSNASTQGRWLVAALGVLVLITMISGAVVAKSGATLSCVGWPLCGDGLIPNFRDGGVLLHVGHRLLALTTVVGLLWGSWRWRQLRHVAVLGFAQVLLGAAVIAIYLNYSGNVQVVIGVVHQFVAMIIFAALVWTFWTPPVAEKVARKEP